MHLACGCADEESSVARPYGLVGFRRLGDCVRQIRAGYWVGGEPGLYIAGLLQSLPESGLLIGDVM